MSGPRLALQNRGKCPAREFNIGEDVYEYSQSDGRINYPSRMGSGRRGQVRHVEWRRVSSTHDLQDLLGSRALQKNRTAALVGGILLIAFGTGLGLLSLWSIAATGARERIASKWSSETFDTGRYYSLLVPLTVPTAIVLVTVHWFHTKLLKHAYA